ncbi:MAG TPA: chemotaxis protein CheW [Acidimicrobiales bacterium]|nr:chemotaxis protein CheW [Acidimicrobiales bacterium]
MNVMRPHRHRHDPSKNLVGFLIGDVSYAVPIAIVREIANPLDVVALPHAPAAVLGVAHYRGEIIPVLDVRARFGLPGTPTTRKTKWIILVSVDRLVAIVVDAVTDVFGTAGAELAPSPPLGGGEDLRGIAGVTTYDGRMVFVLDSSRFKDVAAAAGALGDGAGGRPVPLPRGEP